MANNKKQSRQNNTRSRNRWKGVRGVAKYLWDYQPISDTISKVKRGDIVGALKSGYKHVNNMKGNVVQAFTGRDENSKSWYVVYKPVTPAVNENRPMGALFNTLITNNPTMGSTCRYAEVLMEWEDFTDSYMYKQTITNSYQLLRLKLKSNLPYKMDRLSVYLNNAIQLAIALKQTERDIHWYYYSDPKWTDFAEIFSLRADVSAGYGPCQLSKDKLLTAGVAAESLTSYERLVSVVRTNIKLPPNLALFISHYFGTVFVDGWDDYNDQIIINRMTNFVWKEIDEEGNITTTSFDATQFTIDDLTEKVTKLGTEFGMLIADLVNSEQYVPLYLDSMENYQYQMVYDKSYIQAIQNGYTDNSAVVNDNYIRLDKYPDVDDDLTQFIFSGGYAPREEGALSNVPAITILGMVLKYNSSDKLQWPANLTQGNPTSYITQDQPFGIKVQTSMQSDTYVNITSSSLESLDYPYIGEAITANKMTGIFTIAADAVNGFYSTYNSEIKNYNITVEVVGRLNLTPNTYYLTNVVLRKFNLSNKTWDIVETKGVMTDLIGLRALTTANVSYTNVVPVYKPNLATLNSETLTIEQAYAGTFNFETALATVVLLDGDPIQSLYTYKFTYIQQSPISKYNLLVSLDSQIAQIKVNLKNPVTFSELEYISIRPSAISITTATIYTGGTIGNISYSLVTGFEGIVPLYAKETHAGIPVVFTSRSTVTLMTDIDTQTKVDKSLPMLVKHEHIPYYYNITDLQAVLYDMFVSLFTPTENIYNMLLRRKAEYDRRRRSERKEKKESKSDPEKKESQQ